MGEVYVMHNCAFPELVKIGLTTIGAEARARQLRKTGVPSKFVVLFAYPAQDPRALEKEVHEILDDYRYEIDREFFTVTPQRAIEAVFRAAGNRTLRSDVHSAIEITDRLRAKYGVALDTGLRSARIEFGDYGTTIVTDVRKAGEEIVRRTDLEFIWGDEGPYFDGADDASSAADLFLDLDPYTLGMFTDLFPRIVRGVVEKLHDAHPQRFEMRFWDALNEAKGDGEAFWHLLERHAAATN